MDGPISTTSDQKIAFFFPGAEGDGEGLLRILGQRVISGEPEGFELIREERKNFFSSPPSCIGIDDDLDSHPALKGLMVESG